MFLVLVFLYCLPSLLFVGEFIPFAFSVVIHTLFKSLTSVFIVSSVPPLSLSTFHLSLPSFKWNKCRISRVPFYLLSSSSAKTFCIRTCTLSLQWTQCGALIGSLLWASVIRLFTSKGVLDLRIYHIVLFWIYCIKITVMCVKNQETKSQSLVYPHCYCFLRAHVYLISL